MLNSIIVISLILILEKNGYEIPYRCNGDVTTNIGIIKYDNKEAGRYGVNLRYPQGFEFEEAVERFTNEIKDIDLALNLVKFKSHIM